MLITLNSLYGLLKIYGPDAGKFLQGQLTCDVTQKLDGNFGAHCNPQGRVISFFRIYSQHPDTIFLCMLKTMLPIALGALQKYAIFFKVQLTISTDLNIVGDIEQTQIVLNESNTTHDDVSLWQQHEISQGIPTVYPETSAQFLPQELNLIELNAVNFDKGCYTGQEIIARMHYRAKPKKTLLPMRIQANLPMQRGIDLYSTNEKLVGQIIDLIKIDDTHYHSLIYADHQTITEHSKLYSQINKAETITLTLASNS